MFMAFLPMVHDVSASPTVYMSENWDSGLDGWTATGASVSTDQFVSSPNSLHSLENSYTYKTGTFGGMYDFSVSFSVYPTTAGSPGHSTLFILADNFGTFYSMFIDLSPYLEIGTVDVDSPLGHQHTNGTGLLLNLNQWNFVQCNIFNHQKSIQFEINGVYSTVMWNQCTIGVPNMCMFGAFGVGYSSYEDDLLITDYVPFITTIPPHIISSPTTTIQYNSVYSYFPVADQPGNNWSMDTNATWLSLTGYPMITGVAPIPELYNQTYIYWVNVTFTNPNGTAHQNYTLNVTGIPGNNAADAWLSMTPDQSLLAVLMAAGVIFILITYLTLRRRSG